MTKLKNYQKKAVRKIQHFNGRALLTHEMGLGKTLMVLQWLKLNPKRRPAIVVCPASLKWVWEHEASHHVKMRSEILNGQTPLKKRLTGKHPLLIINYEILQYWLEYILSLNPQVLILDECHYIKSLRTKRTKAVKILSKQIPFVIGVGGTPLLNIPDELWSILNTIRPDEFNSLYTYRWRYCVPVRKPWGWEYKGANNLSELHRRLKSLMMIRCLKKDVLKELPDKTRSVIPLDIQQSDEYKEAKTNFIRWLTKKSADKVFKAKKAERLVQMGYLKRLAAELKMKGVLQWVDNFLEENTGKLVLYCTHRKIIKELHTKYKGISVVVDGSVIGRKRKIAVRSFQNNKRIRIFIGNIRAAGVGITLTAADTLAFVEMDWVPANHTQAEDRIHRIGQKNAAMIYYLIAKNTIEEKLCKLIQKKQTILSKTLDGKAKANELNIFNELEKTLIKEI